MPEIHALLLASGIGTRFAATLPKQFTVLAGRTMLEHATAPFDSHPSVDHVHLVVAEAHVERARRIVEAAGLRKVRRIVAGGATRRESSALGIDSLPGDDRVLIHDVARPCVSAGIIDRCIDGLRHADAVTAAIDAADTILRTDDGGTVLEVPDRRTMRLAQTPQGFRVAVIRRAHELSGDEESEPTVTDDCGLVVRYGLATVHIVRGAPGNLKVTLPDDLERAESQLLTSAGRAREARPGASNPELDR